MATTYTDISRRASDIAGAMWDDRERTGSLADQLRAVADTPKLGTDGDLSDKDRDELRRLALEADQSSHSEGCSCGDWDCFEYARTQMHTATSTRQAANEAERWTCEGSVRGRCGTIHHSFNTAQRHCERDHRGCKQQGGYSDRHPVPLDDAARNSQRDMEDTIRYRVEFKDGTDSLHIHAVGAPDVIVVSTTPRFNTEGHTLAVYDVPASVDANFVAELDTDDTVVRYR